MKTRPALWNPQPGLPLDLRRFVQLRLEAALHDPGQRSLLVWPTILGAPAQRSAHPGGLPEEVLLAEAARMLRAVGPLEPGEAWARDRQAMPGTAEAGPSGWLPAPGWLPHAQPVSLRCGLALLALTGQPEDARYLLSCAVSLFNLSLFHECHDALEILWRSAEGELRRGLQGLILLACGYYHQQHHRAEGMRSIWKDGIPHLGPFGGSLDTPWGRVKFTESLAMALQRLEWLQDRRREDDWDRFWEMPSPQWELT